MLTKAKGWVCQQWMRVPEPKRYKIKYAIWWISIILAALSIATIILHFEDPADAPYVGAIVTVFAFFTFTRMRSTQDGYAHDAEHRLSELHAQNFHYKISELQRSVEIEKYEREKESHEIKQKINDISEGMSRKPQGIYLRFSSRRCDPVPKPPINMNQPVMHISNYQEVCLYYRKAIREHRAHSKRLATMEGVAIIYGAGISAFGGDLINFLNG